MTSFESDLKKCVAGEVHFDPATLGIYATDASLYQMEPVAVFLPRGEDDVLAAIGVARDHHISILPRGAGTSLAGQAVGNSLVIDFSRYMDQVLELNVEARWVRVQPGIVRNQLNETLEKHQLMFAPDPATGSRANVGGMIGNNSSGTRSIVYGKTVDHLLETRVVLSDAEVMEFTALTSSEYDRLAQGSDRRGVILREFRRIIEQNRDQIEAKFPKVMRRVGGYNLDEFIHTDQWNLSKLICGSEGTLATLLEAKLNLVGVPAFTSLCVIHFSELLEAIRAARVIVEFGPSTVEILDHAVLTLARKNLTTAPLCDFLQGDPAAVLLVEFFGSDPSEVNRKVQQLAGDLQARHMGYSWPIYREKSAMKRIWQVRESGLGLMLGMKGEKKPIPFIEDAAIPLEHLPEYIEKVLNFCKQNETEVALYAHASVGVIHVRPILDLRQSEDVERMKKIADYAFELVKGYGGSWSGEHGDGLVRSPFNPRFFGPEIYQAFKDVKKLFDPQNLMNPGKIVEAPPMDHNLRWHEKYKPTPLPTEYHYLEDGGFHAAVEMCSGVGACRQRQAGTMCPSFRATRDEAHSTRGRANALRLAMSGQLGPDGMTSEALYEILDLCLGCKACKSECPSNVDLARLKSEFLQFYHDKHGSSLREKMISASRSMAAFNSGWKAPLVNAIQHTKAFRFLMEKIVKLDRRRVLPDYSRRSLDRWFDQREKPANPQGPRVVLFDDTYLRYHEPRIGISAVELLESCGYQPILARAGCCQRPRISGGFLRKAKTHGQTTINNLLKYIDQGLDIVVCEPSCASALTDDLCDLLGDKRVQEKISEHVIMIDVFLHRQVQEGKLDVTFTSDFTSLLIHGHCHQKALYGTGSMKALLDGIDGLKVNELDAGCCGMAGSFGYEKEHYDLSLKIAGERLVPALEKLDKKTSVIACGFSCRHQIQQTAGLEPLRCAETLRGGIKL